MCYIIYADWNNEESMQLGVEMGLEGHNRMAGDRFMYNKLDRYCDGIFKINPESDIQHYLPVFEEKIII